MLPRERDVEFMANGLHVVIVPSWWPSPERPLHGVFFPDFARAMAEAGVRVGVVTPDLIGARFWRETSARWRTRVEWEAVDGVPVVRVRGRHTSLGRPGIHMRAYRRRLEIGLSAYAERCGSPDVLHAMAALPAGWACTHLGGALASRVLITEHTGPFALLLRPSGAEKMTLSALSRAVEVVAVSANLKIEMQAAGVTRPIGVVGNLVADAFQPGPPPEAPRAGNAQAQFHVAFVGRLTVEKGLRELIAAAQLLAKQPEPRFAWHFVGTGPMESELRAAMIRLDAESVFHGFQNPAGVASILRSSHALVLPSYGENYPLAICEALASGRPVVTTDVPGCAALVGPGDGLMVSVRNAVALADALQRCAVDYAQWDWRAIGARARERFSRARVAQDYIRLYETVRAGGRPGNSSR